MSREWLRSLGLATLIVSGGCGLAPALGQQLEVDPRPAGEARPDPYLAQDPVDFRWVLAPPPLPDSILDRADLQAVQGYQTESEARLHVAELDAAKVYPRFSEPFGRSIDRTTTPVLITLLNRALRDVSATTFAAKEYFQRPRPFQRIQLQRVCGAVAAPKPEAHPTGGSSYPSGHSAYGWAVAMILARVAPEHAQGLMARAEEYAESRMVCGMHFPSDVQAGHTIAAAVIAHLDTSPEFQTDLARARSELASRH